MQQESSGGNEPGPNRTGLTRYRSAPATWLEALLEEDEHEDPLKQNNQSLTELLASSSSNKSTNLDSSASGFFDSSASLFARQNSSPAQFLGNDVDGYFSNYGATLDYMPPAQLKVEQGRMSSMPESEMDKLFEDSVPFRVRAKRGCATHPRSIAERVRRTKISDRIRKLQELVPNMDKQTNTADMLDEAVEYVKYLQKQIQELNEQQKNCKCAIKDQ